MSKNLNGNRITTQQVYELINETRKELNSSIIRLENKFDLLEAGRLLKLETKFANLQGRLTIIAAAVSIGISILFLIIQIFWIPK